MENQAKLNNIVKDAIKIITNPVNFYREIPKTGGFVDPVIFVLVMAVVIGLIIAVFSLFGAGLMGAMATGFGAIILMPIFALIGSFIGAAVLFVIWKLMGSSEPYETAYRCVAYSAAIYPITAVLGLIPYIGTVVGVLWSTYLMVIASINVQQLSKKTTYIVFGIIGALLVVMNLSTEIATRKMTSDVEQFRNQFGNLGKQLGQTDEVTPEQAGQAMGDFLKGLNKAAKKMQENSAIDSTEISTDMTIPEQLSTTNTPAAKEKMTPEQAGKVLGDFLKGFSDAAKENRE